MADEDLLSDVWKVLALHVGTGVADRELLQLRQQWGGARLYLKKSPALPTQKELGERIASGLSVRDAFSAVGCGRTWGYELLGRKLNR
jgi:hypothetical protein